jgi:hypothetical protein
MLKLINPSPETAPTKKGKYDDNNKTTGGDDVDADQKNYDYVETDLMIDPIAWNMLEDSYSEKWGVEQYHSNSGTSNEGDCTIPCI